MEYIIRKVEETDVDKNLLNVFIQGYRLHYTNRPDKFSNRTDEKLKQILLESLQNMKYLVIECNEKIIGYASYQIKEKNNKKALWVDELVIDENCQGKGYGKVLLNKLEETAKEDICNTIEFCCWEFNKKAQDIYEHLNYTIQKVTYEKKID